MLRSEYKRYKDESKSLIPNTYKIELEKKAFIIARASLKHNLYVAIKLQNSKAPRHKIVTNIELVEQVPCSV